MAKTQVHEGITFGFAVILALFLRWFGARFLSQPAEAISTTWLVALGLGAFFVGIMIAGTPTIKQRGLMALGCMLIGAFLLARAAGIIDYPWLARTIGAASWAAAGLALYVTYPRTDKT